MRILVVEDEASLADVIRSGLVAEGFAVDVAENGTDGLWLAGEQSYDAIVLDVLLPGINGFDVCAKLRTDGNWTPVLMLTAKSREVDETKGLDTGADDYLTKPFSFAVLVARLRALIRRGAGPRPTKLVAGDLELDPARHRCIRAGEEIVLTPREFAILEILMRRAGDAISKLEILEHVWDFAFDGDPNIVEVYVGRLRDRIDRPFDRKAIETIRGVGYRLDPTGG